MRIVADARVSSPGTAPHQHRLSCPRGKPWRRTGFTPRPRAQSCRFDLRYNRSQTRERNLTLRPGREGTDLKAGIYRNGRKLSGSEQGNGKTISSRQHR